MKTQIKMTLIASAIAALVSAPAMADDHEGHHGKPDVKIKISKDISVKKDINLKVNKTINKNVTDNIVNNDVRDITVNAEAAANAMDQQLITNNEVDNVKLTNNAKIGDNVGTNASGNIGMNVAAGDTNVQDNAAALAAVDAGFVFGQSTATVDVGQTNMGNTTMNSGVTNTASIADNAFQSASGNIGVNVASGTGNGQKNTMAASVSTSRVASASINSTQASAGNSIRNEGRTEKYTDLVNVTLKGGSIGGYKGAGSGSYSGRTSSTITGQMDQIGNVYPDTWSGASHPSGSVTGHIDLDTATQGGSDLNGDGGALAFGTHDMKSSGSEGGSLGFKEQGMIGLSSVMSGSVATTRYVVINAENDASLSGNAFSKAAGNIGVNVAAGTGNLQSNSLSMAVSCVSCGKGGTGE
ncbi:hypothetical protein A9404_05725 [Halothiobacillus diazotrophicus]|uniref:Adhesin n=1 Tax=Halothiobacillus diazotrophicus TaxID=1860122 RepID=A0A191ZGF0_9GAMM|nr:hypothetical protein [Halothiobacillus diazotrophicus]ANJ66943.1 hypothetical protein A9404_05725 [Halothiobacillus diazotrophicus]